MIYTSSGHSHYYIGTGMKGAQYTLRLYIKYRTGGLLDNKVTISDTYQCNLGTDWEKAIAKARTYETANCKLIRGRKFALNPYGQSDYDRNSWGKKGSYSKYEFAHKNIMYNVKKEAREAQWAKERAMSTHQGKVGERAEFELYFTGKYDLNDMYGRTMLFFVDKDKNAFKWISSSVYNMEKGKPFKMKGTVKSHDEYRGQKQTVITRCKLVS